MRRGLPLVALVAALAAANAVAQEPTDSEEPPFSKAADAEPSEGHLDVMPSGARVEVAGRRGPDRVFVAARCRRADSSRADRLRGPIESIDVASRTIVLVGERIAIADSVRIRNDADREVPLEALAPGTTVRVRVHRDGSAGLRASDVRAGKPEPATRPEKIEGALVRNAAGDTTVLGIPVVDFESALPWSSPREFRSIRPSPRFGARDATIKYSANRPSGFDDTIFLSDRFSIGGRLRFRLRSETNFDLNDDFAGDTITTREQARIHLTARPFDRLFAYFEYRLTRDDVVKDEDRDLDLGWDSRAGENFLYYKGLGLEELSLQVGRQRWADDRRFFFDSDLDAARLAFDARFVYAEAAVGEKLSNTTSRTDNLRNYWLLASAEPIRDERITAYCLDQENTESPDDALYLGLSYRGEPLEGLHPWALGSTLRGEGEEIPIEAWAVDAGATYVLPVGLEPSITLAFAKGTGDESRFDGDDENFRQSGFADNDVRYGGTVRFNGYGVLFRPELSNIEITTIGVGVRPFEKTSLDFVFHAYRQDVAADTDVRSSSSLRRNPRGEDPDLGIEFDAILATLDLLPRTRIKLLFGYFNPDAAFGAHQDDAYFAETAIDFYF